MPEVLYDNIIHGLAFIIIFYIYNIALWEIFPIFLYYLNNVHLKYCVSQLKLLLYVHHVHLAIAWIYEENIYVTQSFEKKKGKDSVFRLM